MLAAKSASFIPAYRYGPKTNTAVLVIKKIIYNFRYLYRVRGSLKNSIDRPAALKNFDLLLLNFYRAINYFMNGLQKGRGEGER